MAQTLTSQQPYNISQFTVPVQVSNKRMLLKMCFQQQQKISDVKRGQNLEAEAEANFWRLRPRPRPKIIMKKYQI